MKMSTTTFPRSFSMAHVFTRDRYTRKRSLKMSTHKLTKQQKHHQQLRREMNADYELAMLAFIAKFGWLTSTQLSIALQIKIKHTRALLHDLLHDKLIDKTYIPIKLPVYFLRQKGVNRLRQLDHHTQAVSGRNLYFGNSRHRRIANNVMLGVIQDVRAEQAIYGKYEFLFWTEYEIQRCLSPLRRTNHRPDATVFKVPDGLYEVSDGRYAWLEVENSRRNPNQRLTLVDFIQQALLASDGGLARYGIRVNELVLASTSPAILRSSIDLARKSILQIEVPTETWEKIFLSKTDYQRQLLDRISWWLEGDPNTDGYQRLQGSAKDLFTDPYLPDFHWPQEALELGLVTSTLD